MAIKITSQDTHADGNLAISGNVNVGGVTSATGGLLTVAYGITAKNIGGTVPYLQTYNSNASTNLKTWRLGGGNGGDLQFETVNDAYSSATERMRITSSGNVGIGTSSPTTTLHVNGESRFANGPININSNSPLLNYSSSDNTTRFGYIYHAGSGSYLAINNQQAGDIWFAANNIERMRITSSGNVGIGTYNPSTTLYVYSNTSANTATIQNVATTGVFAGALNLFSASTNCDAGILRIAAASATSNNALIMGLDGSGYQCFRVQADGTTVVGSTSVVALYASTTSSAAVVTCNAATTNADSRFVLSYQGTNKWHIINQPSSSNRLYILDTAYSNGVYMTQGATSWTSNSDSRLKDVQGRITNALDKVQQLTGVKFTWKRDQGNPDAKVRVGLIAQDVQAVLPEAVDDESPDLITDEETGKISGGLGVRYTEVVPLLVNAIKELTARVVTLEQAAA